MSAFLHSSCLLLLCIAALLLPPTTDAATTLSKPPNNLGLVGYWSFNEGTGTVVTDFSGNGNHGTMNTFANPPTATSGWANGKRGRALNFDGTDDNILVPRSTTLEPASAVSFGAWVNVRTNTAGSDKIILGTLDADSGYGLVLNDDFHGCGATSIGSYVSRGGDSCVSYTSFTINTWYHVMGTFDGDVHRLYVNGVEVASEDIANGSISYQAGGDPFCIGDETDGTTCANGNNFPGAIDEVRIYNRVLGPIEIANLYGQGTGASGAVQIGASTQTLQQGTMLTNGLVGHWTFDGPDVTATVIDRSGQNNHGGFFGGATSSAKVSGKLGQAFNFVRPNETFVRTPSDIVATGDRTACAWAYLDAPIGEDEHRSIFDNGGVYFLTYYFVGGQYYVFFTSQNSFGDSIALTSSPVGVWNHICAARPSAAGNARVYVNGALLGTSSDGSPTAGTTLMIGGDAVNDINYFSGKIDDARIYNRMLTAAEVKQLYRLGQTVLQQ